VVNKGVDF